ncbi:MAG: DNA glycosylase [Gemmatimonadota bacterium]|nr:DNA glycosylase [Gemmatimonadota bacterium]
MATHCFEGVLESTSVNIGLTLGSGQVFRWGRDVDGWWKGIAYGVVVHLRQMGDQIAYRASSEQVATYCGEMEIDDFLRWYLRLDHMPRIRVQREDTYLRRARDLLKGLQFVRQDPFECIISYVLSVQAHMSLTKKRIGFVARTLGERRVFEGEMYWTFPGPDALSELDSGFYRRHRFGWRSERVAETARFIAESIRDGAADLDTWRCVSDDLYALSGSGVGIKVARCIDLFSLDRLYAVPVDTWVRKFAREWYGVTGSDAKICQWGEARWGKWAGYCNEYLFAYYRELYGPTLYDRVLSFDASGEASAVMPFEDAG